MSPEKGISYVSQLIEARCNAQWQLVPELARKVEKHAPARNCLSLAARAEAAINNNDSADAYTKALDEYGEQLSQAIQKEGNPAGDVLDAAVTRASLLYRTANYTSVLSLLHDPLHTVNRPAKGTGSEGLTAVVILHGTLLRGLTLEQSGKVDQTIQTFRSIIAYLSHVVALPTLCLELRRWAEELVTHMCIFFSGGTGACSQQLGETMACLHVLKRLLDSQGGKPKLSKTTYTNTPSRRVWAIYYEALSKTIQEGLVYHPSPLDRDHDTLEHRGLLEDNDYSAARHAQRVELKQVEVNYESSLLKETRFPKASETNYEIEHWVELVMQNWRILCGTGWSDEELGPGGKTGVGRSTLDILYRATTKTFHSAKILRNLFAVHAFLAEFDLAFRAFDKYVEIINRAKARAKKSGSAGIDLDDDQSAIKVAAEAIALCIKYGSSEAAKMALDISGIIRTWIGDTPAEELVSTSPKEKQNTDARRTSDINESLSADLIAKAQRAIGAAEANWARYTFSPPERIEMRRKAESDLRTALRYASNDVETAETLYTLAVLLAENRDIAGAVNAAKRSLQRVQRAKSVETTNGFIKASGEEPVATNRDFSRKVKLLPAFHLLALLMTACEDFDAAMSFCDAGFDQFEDPTNLFGDGRLPGFYTGSVASVNEKSVSATYGIVDELSFIEKQQILEIKITQVSLIETTDGAEQAVNSCPELIALYARLFGNVNLTDTKLAKPNAPPASIPKSSSGTIRSIFRRSKHGQPSYNAASGVRLKSVPESAVTSRPATTTTTAPTIKINGNEEAETRPSSVHRRTLLHPVHGEDFVPKPRNSLKKKSGPPLSRQTSIKGPETELNSAAGSTPMATESHVPVASADIGTNEVSTSLSADQPLKSVPHNLDHEKQPPPPGHGKQPPVQDTRLTAPHPRTQQVSPPPQFIYLQQQSQKISLLVKLWLFIADLFAKSALFSDADEAVSEAFRLANVMQKEVAKESSSVKNFQKPGWGGGQSVEQLWADVYEARGRLLALRSLPHDALESYETALFHVPDHVGATTGLCKILLDIYCEKVPPNRPTLILDSSLAEVYPKQRLGANELEEDLQTTITVGDNIGRSPVDKTGDSASAQPRPTPSRNRTDGTHVSNNSVSAPPSTHSTRTPTTGFVQTSTMSNPMTQSSKQEPNLPTPEAITLLMHRDRAHALLTSLTKLGSAWNNSEAWLTLARAYEESSQEEQAKEALWKVVLLEDDAPLRPWFDALGRGAFIL